MQKISAEPNLSAKEKAISNLGDEELERFLESAQNGDDEAKHTLFCWSYLTAYNYYRLKVQTEKALSIEDAEDLTTAFFLEFERTLPKLKSVTRFTRHVLKRSLNRYIKRKKKYRLQITIAPLDELERESGNSIMEETAESWKNWTDEEFLQYQAVLEALKGMDAITQKIISLRLENPPKPYKEIADLLKMPETALRMRVTRFYGLVRKKYEKIRDFN
jgi:DNA-directed RNA polymerase specialized sigma24 family protein